MSLSDRLRPDVEASPWVIKEVKKLEEELDAAWMALGLVQKENARLREALDAWYSWDCHAPLSIAPDSKLLRNRARELTARAALEEK